MMSHPDSTYIIAESILATRRYEAEEYRRGRERERLAEAQRPAPSLRCRLLALAGGKKRAKALSAIRADRLFTVCG